MKEDILSFTGHTDTDYPFFIDMAGISYCDGNYKISRKNSAIYVFEYILEGEGVVKTDSAEFTAVKGDIYILHKHSNHMYYSSGKNPWTKIWFNARGQLIDNLISTYKLNNINHIEGLDVSGFFFKIIEIASSSEKDIDKFLMEASLIFHELILNIYKVACRNACRIPTEAMELKNYLDRNIMLNVKLVDLSKVIYRSPSQTIRIFKKYFGITPYKYLMNKKIEVAKLMLLNTNISISEISLSLNFNDEHYFSNYFKYKIGIAPSKFRAQGGEFL